MRKPRLPQSLLLIAKVAAMASVAVATTALAAQPNLATRLYEMSVEARDVSFAHTMASMNCDRAGMDAAKAQLDRLEAEAQRAAELEQAELEAGRISTRTPGQARRVYKDIRIARIRAEGRKLQGCKQPSDPPQEPKAAAPQGGLTQEDKEKIARNVTDGEGVDRLLAGMEAARLSGDCNTLRMLDRRMGLILRSTYYNAMFRARMADWRRRYGEILQRPCPPPPPVESVLEDLTPVVGINFGEAGETAASEAARRRETAASEAARRREAERRRKARERLKPAQRTLLDLHNQARRQAGSPPLEWDPKLASQAAAYGPTLARLGRLVHSPRAGRRTSRENLLQALPGTSPQKMMGVWIAERRHFIPGVFPNVSNTGNWADVGHYTQMIWPATTRVGCAIQRGIGRFDWLICRYSPPGNQDGKRIEGRAPTPTRPR